MEWLEFIFAHFWPIYIGLLGVLAIVVFFSTRGLPLWRRITSSALLFAMLWVCSSILWLGEPPMRDDLPAALRPPLGPFMVMKCTKLVAFNKPGDKPDTLPYVFDEGCQLVFLAPRTR